MLTVFVQLIHAQNRAASVSGPWNSSVTWGGQTPPTETSNVTINNGITVTVSEDVQCNNLTFRFASGSLVVNAGAKVEVLNTLRLQNIDNGNTSATMSGAGAIYCNSLIVGGFNTNPAGINTTTLTSNVGVLHVSGNLTVRSEDAGNNRNDAVLNLGSGTVTVEGDVILSADADGGIESTATLSVNNAALKVLGSAGISAPEAGNVILQADHPNALIEYAGASQTVYPAIYQSLTISGSGTKTLNGPATVNQQLRLKNGNFAIGTYLRPGAGADMTIIRSQGTMTGTIQSANPYSVQYFGASKSTGAELSGATIRAVNVQADEGAVITLAQDISPTHEVTIGNNTTLDLRTFSISPSATSGQFVMGANASLRVQANNFPANYASYNISAYNTTIEYYGANQVVPAIPGSAKYSNLVLSGTGVKTLQSEEVTGTLSIRGAATIAGATPVYGPNAVLEYKGSVSQTTSNVEFPGTGASPAHVVIDNPKGVTLNASKQIDGKLSLASGHLTTTTANLLTISSTGVAVSMNGAFVNGPLAKVSVSTEPFMFPVGNLNRGLRVAGVTPQTDATTTYRASFVGDNPKAITNALSGGLTQISSCEYWSIAPTSGNTPAKITLSWNGNGYNCSGGLYTGNTATMVIAQHSGGSWVNEGQSALSGNIADGGTITSGKYVSVFSPFTLGTVSGPSSAIVMFGDVKAFRKSSGVQVEWTNLTERDLDKYEVERSPNGNTFTTVINEQLPKGNNNDKQSYAAFDPSPLAGANFYRIKVYEISGKIIYSKILKVDVDENNKLLTVYPSPVEGDHLTVSIHAKKGSYTMTITNALRQEVQRQTLVHPGGLVAQTVVIPSTLTAGIYNIEITGEYYREVRRFLVQ